MSDQNNNAKGRELHTIETEKTFAEQYDEHERIERAKFLKSLAHLAIYIGVAFCAFLNFSLYSRPFEGWAKLVAIIPALLISGSLLLFIRGNIAWFAIGMQSTLGKVFGWAMFVIESLNAITEWAILDGTVDAQSGLIRFYSRSGLIVAVVVVLAFWKMIIDSDPESMETKRANVVAEITRHEIMEHKIAALSDPANRQKRQLAGRVAARRLTEQMTQQFIIEAEAKPIDRRAVQMAKTVPENSDVAGGDNEDGIAPKS